MLYLYSEATLPTAI